MKISIVTVYNSHNYGSLLQAKQLCKTLKKYGDVSFYNSHSRKLTKTFLRKSKKIITTSSKIGDKVKGPLFELAEMRILSECWKKLPSNESCKDSDVVFLGSDEIWNVTRAACRYPVYWGANISSFKISYAPSVNITTVEDMNKNSEYINYLKEIDCVSVRDSHSKEVIGHYLQEEPAVVLDPTLLYPPEEHDFDYGKPYIAVYLFYGALKNHEIEEIKKFAKEKNMPLISAGQYISWCDLSVHSHNGDPFYIYKNAQYVITNTFHGTAYAINHNTRFVALVKGKTKVEEMLKQFGLSNRILSDISELNNVMETQIDYNTVNEKLNNWRDKSLKYIDESIKKYESSKSK